MSEIGLRSGRVAEVAEANAQTLRYYQRRALLDEPASTLAATASTRRRPSPW